MRFFRICQGNSNGKSLSIMELLCWELVLRYMGLVLIEYKCISSQLITVRALNVATLLCSNNIPNIWPKIGLQLLVVVDSWDGNDISRIQSAQDTWSKYLVMVSLISIAMVRDLNRLSHSTFVVSVRVSLTETTPCCDLLGSIWLSVLPYPQGCVVN